MTAAELLPMVSLFVGALCGIAFVIASSRWVS